LEKFGGKIKLLSIHDLCWEFAAATSCLPIDAAADTRDEIQK